MIALVCALAGGGRLSSSRWHGRVVWCAGVISWYETVYRIRTTLIEQIR